MFNFKHSRSFGYESDNPADIDGNLQLHRIHHSPCIILDKTRHMEYGLLATCVFRLGGISDCFGAETLDRSPESFTCNRC